MYKQCRTEQSAQRQRELEQGLLKMMHKRHYDEISVSDLCQEMGIPRKAFYRYFSGKDGALHSLIDHVIMDFDSFSGSNIQNPDLQQHKYMEQVFSYWVQNRSLLSALARSGLSGVLIQRTVDYTKEMNRLPMLLTNMDKHLREYGNLFAVCGLMTIIVQWHHDGYVPEVEQMAALALRLFREPLYAPTEN
jgi:AcrR family transcriptional regulator